jgi:hypothetical protein
VSLTTPIRITPLLCPQAAAGTPPHRRITSG